MSKPDHIAMVEMILYGTILFLKYRGEGCNLREERCRMTVRFCRVIFFFHHVWGASVCTRDVGLGNKDEF